MSCWTRVSNSTETQLKVIVVLRNPYGVLAVLPMPSFFSKLGGRLLSSFCCVSTMQLGKGHSNSEPDEEGSSGILMSVELFGLPTTVRASLPKHYLFL